MNCIYSRKTQNKHLQWSQKLFMYFIKYLSHFMCVFRRTIHSAMCIKKDGARETFLHLALCSAFGMRWQHQIGIATHSCWQGKRMESVALTRVYACLCSKYIWWGCMSEQMHTKRLWFRRFAHFSITLIITYGFEICDIQKHKCALAHTTHTHTISDIFVTYHKI